jgi:hypothetical protein
VRARLHCYLSREQRWVDRQIEFGGAGEREECERGRLLGFAVATMFTDDNARTEPETAAEAVTGPATQPTRPARPLARSTSRRRPSVVARRRSFEAAHLSEDDAEPDRQRRWLGGADLIRGRLSARE